MRRLHQDPRFFSDERSYDETLLSLQPEDEIFQLVKESRIPRTFRLDKAHLRFLSKEVKRLNRKNPQKWNKSSVLRGIINIYMEEVAAAVQERKIPYSQANDAVINGDAKYWTQGQKAPKSILAKDSDDSNTDSQSAED